VPGEEVFRVKEREKLSVEQREALTYVEQRVLSKWIRTGVQFALNTCVLKLLGMNAVYPIEDTEALTDRKGNVLPDVFLVPFDSTVSDLAAQIHSELARTMIYAVDARTKIRLPTDYRLKDRDVIKIVAAGKARKSS
jgi:ribosome-binding ATPase YchF (GTP1/OBG family)